MGTSQSRHSARTQVLDNSEVAKKGSNHLLLCNTTIGYKCNICENYSTEINLMDHVTERHCNSHFYQCHFCSHYLGSQKDGLFQHQKCKHNIDNCFLTCSLCYRFMSPSEEEMILHIKDIHFTRKDVFVCEYCGFMNENEVDSHVLEKHIDYLCKFPDCKTLCRDPYQLFSHYLNRHYPMIAFYYNCSKCDLVFTKQHSLDQHKKDKKHFILEINDELFDKTTVMFICYMCFLETDTKEFFEKHMKEKHPNILYSCPFKECQYESDHFWIFSQHVLDKHLSHKGVYFYCLKCGLTFKKIYSLIKHLHKEHSKENTCPKCKTQEADLADHFIFEHENEFSNESISCLICNEEFNLEHQLVDHLKQHHSINIPFYIYTDDTVIYT